MLSLGLLDDIHDVHRFPRVQDFVSSCRLVKCARASAGKRYGTSGTTIGKAHLQWAFSDAAVLCLRDHPAAQQYLARLEKKHEKGKALTIRAQQWRVPSITCSHARWLAMGRWSSSDKGGERMSLVPHWTPMG